MARSCCNVTLAWWYVHVSDLCIRTSPLLSSRAVIHVLLYFSPSHTMYRLLSSSCRDIFIHALQFFSPSNASHRLLSCSYRNASNHALSSSTRYIRSCVTFIHAPAFCLSSHLSATKPGVSLTCSFPCLNQVSDLLARVLRYKTSRWALRRCEPMCIRHLTGPYGRSSALVLDSLNAYCYQSIFYRYLEASRVTDAGWERARREPRNG